MVRKVVKRAKINQNSPEKVITPELSSQEKSGEEGLKAPSLPGSHELVKAQPSSDKLEVINPGNHLEEIQQGNTGIYCKFVYNAGASITQSPDSFTVSAMKELSFVCKKGMLIGEGGDSGLSLLEGNGATSQLSPAVYGGVSMPQQGIEYAFLLKSEQTTDALSNVINSNLAVQEEVTYHAWLPCSSEEECNSFYNILQLSFSELLGNSNNIAPGDNFDSI